MTPEQVALAAVAQHEQNMQVLATLGPHAIEAWRLNLDILSGQVASAMEQGWPECLARQLVAANFIAGCSQVQRG